MTEVPVHDRQGKVVETLQFDESCLGKAVHRKLLHDAVVRHEANQRVGTHAAKTRSEVMGSTRKMWRQKGLGRARVGSKRNPIWVGGGITHPPKPRSYRKKLSKKARKTALKSALLAKLRDGELKVVTDLDQEAPRTKEMAAVLRALEAPCNCLVVLPAANETTWKSLRNLPEVSTTVVREMNAYETLRRRYVVMTKTAFEALPEEMK